MASTVGPPAPPPSEVDQRGCLLPLQCPVSSSCRPPRHSAVQAFPEMCLTMRVSGACVLGDQKAGAGVGINSATVR